MIARRWRAWADGPAQANAYVAHFEGTVRPQLEGTDGFMDATLERVQDPGGRTEVVVVTRWASMDAVRSFAGDEVDVAVVEDEARAVLAVAPNHVLSSGSPWRLEVSKPPVPRRTPDEAAP